MQNLIERIKNIEREQRRRSNSPLKKYNRGKKVHLKQLEFHKCLKRNRWVFGGNRSGKTECGAVETVWLARGIHPYRPNVPNAECWVVSLSQQVQRDVAQQKVLRYLDKGWIKRVVMSEGSQSAPEYGVIDYLVIANVFGGESKIAFKSCEAGRDKFQGASLDFVWFDEEPPYEIYQECRMRVLDRKGEIFGTMTPLKGLTWVYDEIYLNSGNSDEVWCCFMEWADNPYLDSDEVAAMTSTLSADSLESRRYGHFRAQTGLVYSEFDDRLHVIDTVTDLPTEFQQCLSIDPGLNNPLSCHWYCRDFDGNVYVVAEHYEAGRDVAYHAQAIKRISDALGWKRDKRGRLEAYIDSAANQRTLSGMKTVAELFFDNGIAVNTRVNKDVTAGINVVKSYLKVSAVTGKPRLFICRNCVNMIREIKGYFWADNDKPRKADDHAMDELRYFLCAVRDETKRTKPVKSAVACDKERLCRRLTKRGA
ncbi:MAG: terminase family protein [Corallococcus sp.]|nr:terminase family protein [Corallococcus sp.]